MKVIKQTPLAEGMLLSTNVVEVNPAWSSLTTYAKDALVYEGSVGTYQSLVNSNLNHQPSISPTQWVRIGPTNVMGMFDEVVGTQTVSPSPVVVSIATGMIDSVAILNVNCKTVRLRLADGISGPIKYDQTVNMITNVNNWEDYFFSDVEKKTQTIFENLPRYSSAVIELAFTGTGEVKVGEVVFGKSTYIGGTQYGMSAGITDYSKKVVDEYGNATLSQGAFNKRMNTSVYVKNSEINKIQRLLYDLRATPAVWIATPDEIYADAAIVYGFYKDFSCEISYPTRSIYNLEIEGLI